ncbi:hypothetical protein DDP54_07025 [Cellulomonas sp. WB94]|nr:hypothetical protein DDP54_07025 [Cellulomonas sp. WB94]
MSDGELAQARSLYALLDATCAERGVAAIEEREKTAARLAAVGQALMDETPPRPDDARGPISIALALDPQNTVAQAVDEALDAAAAPSLCSAAAARLAAGEIDTAAALYAAAAGVESTKECGELGTAEVARLRAESPPQRLTAAISGTLLPWFEIGAFTVAVIMVLGVVGSTLIRDPLKPRKKSVGRLRAGALIAFGGAAVAAAALLVGALGHGTDVVVLSSEVRRWAAGHTQASGAALVLLLGTGTALLAWAEADRRRLAFQPATGSKDADLSDLTALVAAEFSAFAGGAPMSIVRQPATELIESPVATVLKLSSNTAVTAAITIWKMLTPGIDLTVSTHVHWPASGPPIAVVTLTRGRSELGRQVINGGDYADKDRATSMRDLATAIAAWVLMQIRPAIADPVRLYGAKRWDSVARTAVASRRLYTDPTARRLLVQAVESNPENMQAQYGLVRTRLAGKSITDNAYVEGWGSLLQMLPPDYLDLPLGWRARYAYAAALGNRAQQAVREGAGDMADRTGESIAALDELKDLLEPWESEEDGPGRALGAGQSVKDRPLALTLLNLVREAREAMSVSNAIATGADPLAVAEQIRSVPAAPGPTPQYNRACAYGVAYDFTVTVDRPEGDTTWLTEALSCLQSAFEDPTLKGWARSDPCLHGVVASPEYRDLFPPEPADAAPTRSLGSLLVAVRTWWGPR